MDTTLLVIMILNLSQILPYYPRYLQTYINLLKSLPVSKAIVQWYFIRIVINVSDCPSILDCHHHHHHPHSCYTLGVSFFCLFLHTFVFADTFAF